MKKKYIAKANTWFKEGTECIKEEIYFYGAAMYSGTYIVGS